MRFFVVAFALVGFIALTGCANTAAGFGRDLERTGESIQKSVGPKTAPTQATVNSQNQYPAQAPQQLQPATTTDSYQYNNNSGGYAPTPSGY